MRNKFYISKIIINSLLAFILFLTPACYHNSRETRDTEWVGNINIEHRIIYSNTYRDGGSVHFVLADAFGRTRHFCLYKRTNTQYGIYQDTIYPTKDNIQYHDQIDGFNTLITICEKDVKPEILNKLNDIHIFGYDVDDQSGKEREYLVLDASKFWGERTDLEIYVSNVYIYAKKYLNTLP